MVDQLKTDALRAEVTLYWARADRGELTPTEALTAILERIDHVLNLTCVVEDAMGAMPQVRSPRADDASMSVPARTRIPLSDAVGTPSGSVTFYGVVVPGLAERLAHVIGRVRGLELRSSAASTIRHDIGNTLAALLSNIELMELLLGNADPSEALLSEASATERASFLRGLELTAASARTLVVSFERLRGHLGS